MGYPAAELARAAETAGSHPDAQTRQRARERFARWSAVLRRIAGGSVSVGSRQPVADLPFWATPQVVRGGFATGEAVAGGPLRPYEAELARRAGVPAQRDALFAYHLTEAGLAELSVLLESGAYRVETPEEAALLTVAWLLRAGDETAAVGLVDELRPHAHRLRFTPAPDDAPAYGPEVVWRETAGAARERLARRKPNGRVAAMQEALTVWNPFADQLLELWLETARDGQVGARTPAGWSDRAAALVERYHRLAAAHPHCGKHRRPKENLAILRAATEEAVAGRPLSPRARGLLQHAVDSMVRRRGRPGSPEHAALRERQSADAAGPMLHTLARVVVNRLAVFPPGCGIRSVEAVTGPITPEEAAWSGVPAGARIAEPIRRVVRRALAGTVAELIAAGVVPSAEVLARLVPQIAATATAASYPDEALRSLTAATYRAFRNRRSLLLTNLEHQVRLDELPWVRAVAGHRSALAGTHASATSALRRLGELALDGFPATLLPNPLVRELVALDREAGGRLPWVEELATDSSRGPSRRSTPPRPGSPATCWPTASTRATTTSTTRRCRERTTYGVRRAGARPPLPASTRSAPSGRAPGRAGTGWRRTA
ncbi:transcriptional regulator [Micromonospora musae]|uniref:Transcriptional regulator n=1 Tax=Micromonospora musae TaxID=1894970 RepID=A0A3A9YB26_9ACTN|nr:transcriptional regulator [Micromonospora musae]RKN34428.1 transcriptional regulator [Micromonospora musae]